LGESLGFLADVTGNSKAAVLGAAVDIATQGILDNNKSPARKVGQTDNRDSHYFFALYWAEALAAQTDDAEIAAHFAPIAKALSNGQEAILAELASVQGAPADTGGYYHPDRAKLAKVWVAFLFAQTLGQIPQNLHKCAAFNIGCCIRQGEDTHRTGKKIGLQRTTDQ